MRWFLTIAPKLLDMGFIQRVNNKCTFRHPNTKACATLHADDMLVQVVRERLDSFFAQL